MCLHLLPWRNFTRGVKQCTSVMEVKSCPFKIGGLGSVSFFNQPLISLLIFLPFSWLLIHHVGSDRKTKWDESSWSWVGRDWWWVPSARSTLWYQQLWGLAVSPPHAFTGLGRAPTIVPVSFRWDKTLNIHQRSAHQCLSIGMTSLLPHPQTTSKDLSLF